MSVDIFRSYRVFATLSHCQWTFSGHIACLPHSHTVSGHFQVISCVTLSHCQWTFSGHIACLPHSHTVSGHFQVISCVTLSHCQWTFSGHIVCLSHFHTVSGHFQVISCVCHTLTLSVDIFQALFLNDNWLTSLSKEGNVADLQQLRVRKPSCSVTVITILVRRSFL